MQTLNDYEIDAVNGGSRVVKALDWIGRGLTALGVTEAAAKAGKALAEAKGTHMTRAIRLQATETQNNLYVRVAP